MTDQDIEHIQALSDLMLEDLYDRLYSGECPVDSCNCFSCGLFNYPICVMGVIREELKRR